MPPTSQPAAPIISRRIKYVSRGALLQFDPERQNLLVNRAAAILSKKETSLLLGESQWQISLHQLANTAENAGHPCEILFRCVRGNLRRAAVALELELVAWSECNYVLLPAGAYNGNRFLARKIPYSPKLYFTQDIGPKQPVIITDVPRLNISAGVSSIQIGRAHV